MTSPTWTDFADDLHPNSKLYSCATFSYIEEQRPKSCSIILRDFHADSRQGNDSYPRYFFFTDKRSAKVAALQKNNSVSLCIYNRDRLQQFVFTANANVLESTELTEFYWGNQTLEGQLAYGVPNPYVGTSKNIVARDSDLEQAKRNFAVISLECLSLDYLLLSPSGNLRYSCDFNDETRRFIPWENY